MNNGSPQQFKNVIEQIVDVKLNNRGITKYVSAIIDSINEDGTVNVHIPPDTTHTLSNVPNKSGEPLFVGNSVELCTKNGKTNNAWVAVKHGLNASASAYPIGAIYMSTVATSPASLFGGTWERIQGKFLLCADDSKEEYYAGKDGGSYSKKITTDHLPAHTHGSKSLSGSFNMRSINSGDQNPILGADGICSVSRNVWSGRHDCMDVVTLSDYKTNLVSVNASHEHSSVGKGTDFNIMPPFLSVYCWKRIG